MQSGLFKFFRKIGYIFEDCSDEFLVFCPNKWPKAHFLPTFKMKVATLKPSVHAGLREKSPLAHFFSYLIAIKRLKKYIDMAKISGHLTKGVKNIFFTNSIGGFSFAKKTYPFMKREG